MNVLLVAHLEEKRHMVALSSSLCDYYGLHLC